MSARDKRKIIARWSLVENKIAKERKREREREKKKRGKGRSPPLQIAACVAEI